MQKKIEYKHFQSDFLSFRCAVRTGETETTFFKTDCLVSLYEKGINLESGWYVSYNMIKQPIFNLYRSGIPSGTVFSKQHFCWLVVFLFSIYSVHSQIRIFC